MGQDNWRSQFLIEQVFILSYGLVKKYRRPYGRFKEFKPFPVLTLSPLLWGFQRLFYVGSSIEKPVRNRSVFQRPNRTARRSGQRPNIQTI